MKNRLVELAIAGMLLSLAVVVPKYLWFLSFLAFLPLLTIAFSKDFPSKTVFFGGLVFGSAYFAIILGFFWQSVPLRWIGIENLTPSIFLVFLVWFITVFLFATAIGLWAVCLHSFSKKIRGYVSLLFLPPALWVLFEFIRGIAFSVIWAGPESTIGDNFTYGHIGYALSGSQFFLPLASFGGVYLLSFITVFLATFIHFLFLSGSGIKNKRLTVAFFGLLFLLYSGWLLSRDETSGVDVGGKTLKVALFNSSSPSFLHTPSDVIEKKFLQVRDALEVIKRDGNKPDIVLLPEDTGFLVRLGDNQKTFLSDISVGKETLFIDSSRILGDSGRNPASIIFAYNSTEGELKKFKKNILLPGGEYQPYLVALFGHLLAPLWFTSVQEVRGYEKGNMQALLAIRGATIGVTACSEIASPSFVRKLSQDGAEIIVNLSSQAIFNGSFLLRNQSLAILQVRAVENGKQIIQAGDMVPSYIIDRKGTIKTSIMNGSDKGVIFSYENVVVENGSTFYIRYGDWILFLALIIVVVTLYACRRDSLQKHLSPTVHN